MEREKKTKVMIVDDEEGFLIVQKMNLEQTGKYKVMTLSSGKGILYHVHTFRPDVILLDILMPEVDGIEVCAALNDDPLGQKIPIIVISALHTQEDQLKAYKSGIVDYIVKPAPREEVIAKIENALRYR
jgi:PleD family two-component response regulator